VLCCAGGLARALQGVKSVIALGKLGSLLPAAQCAGVERVVLLSTAGELGVCSGALYWHTHQRQYPVVACRKGESMHSAL
jgi:hypothetical protein